MQKQRGRRSLYKETTVICVQFDWRDLLNDIVEGNKVGSTTVMHDCCPCLQPDVETVASEESVIAT